MSESASGKADSGIDPTDKDVTECPTCGRTDFKSNEGMRRHHAMAHDESLSYKSRECKNCGDKFEVHVAWLRKENAEVGQFCSKECNHEFKRDTITCEACGETFTQPSNREHRFCSRECAYGNRKHDVAHTKECEICGDEFRTGGKAKAENRVTCGKECFKEWLTGRYTGEDNWTWKGGYDNYYGDNWREQRQKARERDNFECQVCGLDESDYSRELSVHHITPVRKYDQPEDANVLDNLITMCEPCHSKWEGLYLRPDNRGRNNE